ncbi:MAG: fumarylacetoacetate hydrolase family protein [Pseudomonadales bacterium]|nr:fumarylacetoacetate hydrolase family protein [Pseudomonadales bacterium]
MSNTIVFDGNKVCPSKIVCVGRNYVDHIRELGNELPKEPVIFIKPNSSISNQLCTHDVDEIHYEGEISFLIVDASIVAVGFGLDLTKRKIQSELKERGLPWERAKAFDQSAVFSHFVSIDEDVSCLRMELYINGNLMQASGCQYMINTPAALLKEITSFMTLQDYDVVMTGTPSGVGEVKNGDNFICKLFNDDDLLLQHSWQAQ